MKQNLTFIFALILALRSVDRAGEDGIDLLPQLRKGLRTVHMIFNS